MSLSILIVDDDIALNTAIKDFMVHKGYHTAVAFDAEQALASLKLIKPDIILTDIVMPGMNGLQLTRRIRESYDVAIMVMTGLSEEYSYEEAIDSGASDFIFKPFGFKELDLRIKRMIREMTLKRENTQMVQHLEKLAVTDHLTGLFNSRCFFDQLSKEIQRHSRYNHPLSLLLFDIDDFKTYNDTWGHLEGDNVLSAIGKTTASCLRNMDTAYRYGGEEFTILLPETPLKNAEIAGKRICSAIRKLSFQPNGASDGARVTISMGATGYQPEESLKSFVKRADMAMYQSKKEGKNRLTLL